MHVYKYKGYDASGRKVEGELSAISAEEAERKVTQQAVTIIALFPSGRKGGPHAERPHTMASTSTQPRGLFERKPSVEAIANLLRDLAVMSETGVPFIEALDSVIASASSPRIREGLTTMRDEIIGGRGLSSGMRSANLFPVVVCEMVKVAEEGGRLDRALASAAGFMERSASLRKKVGNAMLYPAVLTFIALSTVVVMITFVLPRFANIFKSMRAELPPTTVFLLGLGETLRTHPWAAIGSILGLGILLKIVWGSEIFQAGFFQVAMRLPIVGELLRRLALSRAIQSISVLLGSNVSLLAALHHGAEVAGNPVIRDAFLRARTSVEHGATLADSMAETRVFPSQLVQMVAVGERTGRLAMLMKNTAQHMEEDIDGRLKALISIVEPVMIVVMGAIVGGITLSIIVPMYSVVQNVR